MTQLSVISKIQIMLYFSHVRKTDQKTILYLFRNNFLIMGSNKIKFNKKDYLEALSMMRQEWRTFDVPAQIHEFVIELAWKGTEQVLAVKQIMEKYDCPECYAAKCYFFSDAFKYEREKYARIGMYYRCEFCREECLPKKAFL